ncbi:5-deoxy-glucuronate isomerase [Streptomyces bohaiensis]|uniref:5-deoxy-glucuronate isomerase n=1 Tax=Streptomyces bohaiensis TaxID=1431344 RepID=A0ABX1C7N0_9ACTN|nr:5-deoxy-glucuronate isomerase [Streptomyces bohaiensis]NJQ14246.1 5-deoxy-glucuronate isomerase [Streptomyces bohaiensis]
MTYHLPAGTTATGPYHLDISPERAGWAHSALRVLHLDAGGSHTFRTADSEWIVLPLAGGATVTAEGQRLELRGRPSVFAGPSDFAYVPRDTEVTLVSPGGARLALAGARCERRLPLRLGRAEDVPVELRGGGVCSRQVHNFAAADVFEADRLIAVEVFTPGGNWSSYPPHKHDEDRPGEESALEEIYYYEFTADDTAGTPPGTPGFGYQRVSSSGHGRGTEVLAEVRDGDAVVIPDGWHGPSVAAPGHHMYYLNVMAGPGPERSWLISDHPDHTWVRATWPATPVDFRLPLPTAPDAGGDMGEGGTGVGTDSGDAAGDGPAGEGTREP